MSFELTILGSNSAVPAFGRHPSSQVLSLDGNKFLIDCGEGCQLQMSKYNIKRGKLDHIFISHLHGDHYFGLFGLINTLNLNGRGAPLNIYGPPDLEGMLQSVLGDYSHRLQYDLNFHSLTMDSAEIILETKDCRVSTLVMNHSIECLGFQFEQIKSKPNVSAEKLQALGIEGKAIGELLAGEKVKDLQGNPVHLEDVTLPSSRGCIYTYCADTARRPENIQRLQDTDVLYHEATFLNSRKDRAKATGHSTAEDAAWMAKEAGVKDLLIGHFSARYENLEPLLKECQASFGRSHLALEGHSFELSTEGLKLV